MGTDPFDYVSVPPKVIKTYNCAAWETIESAPIAPLDRHGYGPTIFLWVDGNLGVGFWDRDFMRFYIEYPDGSDAHPSHWMPLPPAPTAGQE